MTDRPQIRFSRRFTIPQAGGDIHGVEFPSGRVLYDQPGIGIGAAVSIEYVPTDTPDADVHWADEENTDGR